ncbi:MAG: hypothetical protein HC866_23435 [Leptolyngbyaceae cyanobacterium RU_5_1]|nr:hypothetical protein [Leptolyngbyaceae cyanobacterium RU_5_1]
MSLFLTDFEQWYDAYEAASPSQQYALIQAAIAQPIAVEYAEENDFGTILLELWDLLVSHNLAKEALALIATLQQRQPDLYQREFQYFADFLIRYHLFHHQVDSVKDNLAQFKANPIQGIDQLFAVLDNLRFYGVAEPSIDLCKTVYRPVQSSNKVIGGAEIELGSVVIIDLFDQAYRRLKQGEPVDWEAFGAEASEYGFENDASMRAEIEHNLTVPIQVDAAFLKQFSQKRGSCLRQLMLGFCRSMDEQQQMSFVCSQAIWETLIEFLEQRDLPKKQLTQPAGYFGIDQAALDGYVARKIGGFLSLQQSKGFAILWGIPYLYDFLYDLQVIEERIYQKVIAATRALKPQLIKGFQTQLWQYDFVHRWQKPDSIPEAEFLAEAEQFAASLEQSEPLSDRPVDRFAFPSWLGSLGAKNLNPDIARDRVEPNAQPTPAVIPTWEPAKPRKSPLQEASDLAPKKPSQQSQQPERKKKKGFR